MRSVLSSILVHPSGPQPIVTNFVTTPEYAVSPIQGPALSRASEAPGTSDALFQLRDLDNLRGIYLCGCSASISTISQFQMLLLPSQVPVAPPDRPP